MEECCGSGGCGSEPQWNRSLAKINAPAPNFQAEAFHNNEIKRVKLSDFRGKWVVVVFYPADFTFICPTELGDLADKYPVFQQLNTEVLSVSTDTAFVHKAWFDSSPMIGKVKFPMVADPTGEICRAFGTYIEHEGLSLRGTFLIDPEGVLKAYEIHDNSLGRSTNELLRKVKAAQYVQQHGSEVCPVNWEPGKETLQPGLDKVGKI